MEELARIYDKEIKLVVYVSQDSNYGKYLLWKDLIKDIHTIGCYLIKFDDEESFSLEVYNGDPTYSNTEDLMMNCPLIFDLDVAISTIDIFRKLRMPILVTDGEWTESIFWRKSDVKHW